MTSSNDSARPGQGHLVEDIAPDFFGCNKVAINSNDCTINRSPGNHDIPIGSLKFDIKRTIWTSRSSSEDDGLPDGDDSDYSSNDCEIGAHTASTKAIKIYDKQTELERVDSKGDRAENISIDEHNKGAHLDDIKKTPADACTLCSSAGFLLCARCRCRYCSKECQKADWSSHRYLCKSFHEIEERPTKYHHRVIEFLPDEKTPRWKWQKSFTVGQENQPSLVGKEFKAKYTIRRNLVTGRRLEKSMDCWYMCVDGYKINRNVIMTTSGIVPTLWKGLVMITASGDFGKDNGDQCRDLDMSDVRPVVDFLSTFFVSPTLNRWAAKLSNWEEEYTGPTGRVAGVRLHCDLDRARPKSELDPISMDNFDFSLVQLARQHPIFPNALLDTLDIFNRHICPLSAALGFPIYIWRPPHHSINFSSTHVPRNGEYSNDIASFLMRDVIRTTGSGIVRAVKGSAHMDFMSIKFIGTVILARADGKPLLHQHVDALVKFILAISPSPELQFVTFSQFQLEFTFETLAVVFRSFFESYQAENAVIDKTWKSIPYPLDM
jgi:hypothetical protein